MGSINGKEDNNTSAATTTIPPSVERMKQRKMEYISPLHRSSAFENKDPRSPGGLRRSPINTPHSTPPLSKAYRERALMRFGSPAKFSCVDPRSPAAQRTPVSLPFAFEHVTPPPFSLGGSLDPRSPYMMRTPLSLSSAEETVIMDDVVVVEEKIMRQSGETPEKPIDASEAKEPEKVTVVVVESSGVMESTSTHAFRESFSSSGESNISPALMALSISPLGSPAFGYRKRKSIVDRYPSLSPLKKSYSAPGDENTPPSALKLSAPTPSSNNKQQTRAPLSPLSLRAVNNKRCMDVQPIKFRMEPGVLGL